MALAPQFAALQDQLGGPAPPAPPLVLTPPDLPSAPEVPPKVAGGLLSSPWLWVALAVLVLVGLFFWYKSRKNGEE